MEILRATLRYRSRRASGWSSLTLIALLVSIAMAAPAQVDEYHLKAAFLLNFAKFVEWPPQAFAAADDPITICILGKNPFGNILAETVSGKTVAGRPLVVRQLAAGQPVSGCPILFVSASEDRRFRAMAGSLKGAGILTVGESEGFAAEGGIINFKLERGNIRLEINAEAAEEARVHISSKLLSLAQIVRRPA